MGAYQRYENDDYIIGGIVKPYQLDIPAGTIVDADVLGPITAAKLQRPPAFSISQSGTAVTATHLVRFVKGSTGTLKYITVSNITSCAGSSTVTVDVKKNGTTVLSSIITLNSSTTAYQEVEGVISVASLADGDYLTVEITANQSGTDALSTGVLVQIDWDEDYAA